MPAMHEALGSVPGVPIFKRRKVQMRRVEGVIPQPFILTLLPWLLGLRVGAPWGGHCSRDRAVAGMPWREGGSLGFGGRRGRL